MAWLIRYKMLRCFQVHKYRICAGNLCYHLILTLLNNVVLKNGFPQLHLSPFINKTQTLFQINCADDHPSPL